MYEKPQLSKKEDALSIIFGLAHLFTQLSDFFFLRQDALAALRVENGEGRGDYQSPFRVFRDLREEGAIVECLADDIQYSQHRRVSNKRMVDQGLLCWSNR